MKWFFNLFRQPPESIAIAHRTAMANFSYISQPNEWVVIKKLTVHNIAKPFKGDCDDFAASVADYIGGAYAEVTQNGERHAIAIKDGWVSDNQRSDVYYAGTLRAHVMFEMWAARRNGYVVVKKGK